MVRSSFPPVLPGVGRPEVGALEVVVAAVGTTEESAAAREVLVTAAVVTVDVGGVVVLQYKYVQ